MADAAGQLGYDRAREVKEFDDTKAGVKGLVDSGVTKLPRIFYHAAENLPKPSDGGANTGHQVPIVDLKGVGSLGLRRREIVDDIHEASKTWGFFQLVNHGIPVRVLEGMIQGTRKFHEQDKEVKATLYSRDRRKTFKYSSNFDLFQSPAANWRDSLSCYFDGYLDPQEIPPILRKELMEYRKHMLGLADTVCELLSEALGLSPDYLRSINCAKTQALAGHYYPPCPEPERTLGTTRHTDASFLTLVIQDDLGGLQVLHHDKWVNVAPIYGAVLVNIGDLLQLISNDMFKSVEHRVLASRQGPRLSVAIFLTPSLDEEKPYGPIKEILSDDNPPRYQQTSVGSYLTYLYSKGLTGESLLTHFRL